eukprot:CAMPEP_0206500532 /NCGR_PEP_ID=MMETSP0324_2-20121206/52575_1 /ASSEMBLY_ACC=CAM_ASM_000836 /TAXON_ID=2866 /ORGANISM="Crypthecodinium cohnii, Strain Seligo" /LENGTH=81 /DNA_ID=CAMNT_0053987787 /DNA_START=31 /DNA_END=273 /DNA_ORIENTATION=-
MAASPFWEVGREKDLDTEQREVLGGRARRSEAGASSSFARQAGWQAVHPATDAAADSWQLGGSCGHADLQNGHSRHVLQIR